MENNLAGSDTMNQDYIYFDPKDLNSDSRIIELVQEDSGYFYLWIQLLCLAQGVSNYMVPLGRIPSRYAQAECFSRYVYRTSEASKAAFCQKFLEEVVRVELAEWSEGDLILRGRMVFRADRPARVSRSKPRRSISQKLRFQILKRDGFRCVYCGRSSAETDLAIDHIHPVAKGGTDDLQNLCTSCTDCNQGKTDSIL